MTRLERLADLPVLDASPNAIVGVDSHARIVYVNPQVATTFGWAQAELLGQPIERLIPDALAGRHAGHRAAYLEHPVARPMSIGLDLAGRRKDGSEFPVEISLAPVAGPDGILVFATVVDISARKALEAQLLQAQKMESVGRLAGGIAHDFNNMLFAIRGYADLLDEDLDRLASDGADVLELRSSVEGIAAAADKATALTSQLLAFGRRQHIQPVVLNLGEAVASLESMLRRLLGERVEIVLDLDRATGRVEVDPGQLDQAVMNLVVNARDAMPDGGTIRIETGNVVFDEPYAIEHFDVQPGDYVMLAVSDTGHGMDQETRRHVFEPFFTTKEPGKGTGLGLATTFGIVRSAGGHIWVYSEPGRGTTFKIYFPRAEAPAEARPGQHVPAETTSAGRVLLVEDEPAVRDLTRRVLERAGYLVTAPTEVTEALQLVEPGGPRFDVLVTDLVMPGLSGRELARRALAVRSDLAVVLLSGYSAETARIGDLVEAGATFASKPLSSRDLLRVVAEARAARAAA
ncbi:MAG TPA: ATP-binding protein [Candidatus Dormibacteraeota bacterium]|nr:ATP-binding protein [Candidatus Dormibacteraeota bacterium]